MTAQIIPFPASFQLPSHWSGHDEYIFNYFRKEGLSVKEAAERIEREIGDKKPRYPGEDVLLRMAQEAISRMTKRR